jgi:hypothetical protein
MPIQSIPIELDKPRNLRYGIGTQIKVEKLLGCKITQIDMSKIGMEEWAKIVYAGLEWEDKTLTVDKTIALIDDNADNVEDVIDKAAEAFNAAYPDKSKNSKGPVATNQLTEQKE